jgi:hypothetical protein
MAEPALPSRTYETEKLGVVDDFSIADGVAILDFWQGRIPIVGRAHTGRQPGR